MPYTQTHGKLKSNRHNQSKAKQLNETKWNETVWYPSIIYTPYIYLTANKCNGKYFNYTATHIRKSIYVVDRGRHVMRGVSRVNKKKTHYANGKEGKNRTRCSIYDTNRTQPAKIIANLQAHPDKRRSLFTAKVEFLFFWLKHKRHSNVEKT